MNSIFTKITLIEAGLKITKIVAFVVVKFQ